MNIKQVLEFWLGPVAGTTAFQFFRYLSVGVVNTLVDLAVFFILVYVFPIFIHPTLAKGLSFLCALHCSFFLNGIWTFRDGELNHRKLLLFYVSVGASGLVNIGVYHTLAEVFGFYDLLSVLVASLATALCGFLLSKFVVFKK